MNVFYDPQLLHALMYFVIGFYLGVVAGLAYAEYENYRKRKKELSKWEK